MSPLSKRSLIAELKARREAVGWAIEEVGQRCGVDETSLRDWESGIGSPPLDAVQSWAACLDLELSLRSGTRTSRPSVSIDWDARCIAVDGTPVRLTPMEWKALERLAKVPGELVSHEALFRHLYGDGPPYRSQSTAIRVLITKLRRLLPLRIEARWGRGYVVAGIEPPSVSEPVDQNKPVNQKRSYLTARPVDPAPGKPRSLGTAHAPEPGLSDMVPSRRNYPELSHPAIPRVTATSGRPNPCRAEELGVIERFLAERGATRCPDVATIQRSPLPTLVWDKNKRKWVRPAPTRMDNSAEREAS